MQPRNSHWHNIPAALSSFVGRERELVEVERALAMIRLLMLPEVGGSGKTLLALKVDRELARTYLDGAWFAELALLSDPHLLPAYDHTGFGPLRARPCWGCSRWSLCLLITS